MQSGRTWLLVPTVKYLAAAMRAIPLANVRRPGCSHLGACPRRSVGDTGRWGEMRQVNSFKVETDLLLHGGIQRHSARVIRKQRSLR